MSHFLSSKQHKCDLASDNANPVESNFFDIIDLNLAPNVWVDFSVVILLKVNTEYQQNYNYLVSVEENRVEGKYNRSKSFEFYNIRVYIFIWILQFYKRTSKYLGNPIQIQSRWTGFGNSCNSWWQDGSEQWDLLDISNKSKKPYNIIPTCTILRELFSNSSYSTQQHTFYNKQRQTCNSSSDQNKLGSKQ